MRYRLSLVTFVALCFSLFALRLSAQATDVTAMDVSGVKLGMTVSDARAALKAKISLADDTYDRDEHELAVDCATGTKLAQTTANANPNATILDNAIVGLLTKKTKSCVGQIVVTFKTTNVEVDFQAQDGAWIDPRVSAVQYTQISPPVAGAPDDDAPNTAFIQNAVAKFGTPSLSFKYPATGTKELIWCPDGTEKETCKNVVQYQTANPPLNLTQTNHNVPTPPTKNFIVYFGHKTRDGAAWYNYSAMFDLSRYVGGPAAAAGASNASGAPASTAVAPLEALPHVAGIAGFDVSGIRLGMSIAEARQILTAKMAEKNTIQYRTPNETYIGCDRGGLAGGYLVRLHPDGSPIDTQQRMAQRLAQRDAACIGQMLASIGPSTVTVYFRPRGGNFHDERVSSVELKDVVTPGETAATLAKNFMHDANVKFGKPTVDHPSDRDGNAYRIWCPEGTSTDVCTRTPGYVTREYIDNTPEVANGPGLPAKTYLVVGTGGTVGGSLALYARLVDLSTYTAPEKPAAPSL